MGKTTIEWADYTFNPWEGCTKVSAGCAHCYAEARNARFGGGVAPNWGKGAPRRRTSAANWALPLRWNREASRRRVAELHSVPAGQAHAWRRPRVFCASLADVLDDEVPIAWLADLTRLIAATPELDWLLLTKRPENWFSRMGAADVTWRDWVLPANVWLGVSVEDQRMANFRIPLLLKLRARTRFLSVEPMLGPIDLTQALGPKGCLTAIDWVICGGESGPHSRRINPDWVKALHSQCRESGIPFFFKQWGGTKKTAAGRSLNGALCQEVPR